MSLLIVQPCLPLATSKDTVFSSGMTSLSDQIAHKRNKALAQGHVASLVTGVIEGVVLLLGCGAYWWHARPPSQPFPASSHHPNPPPTGGFRSALLWTSQNPSNRQLLYASVRFPKLSDLCLIRLQPFEQLLFLLGPQGLLLPNPFLPHRWILQFQR